ncbi:tyrosine-type recombinase/integrase [Acidimangrovimonas sediminis]|uniref:tyrosine-type recombinase/integrase n=1 Tax=Acidimangrovimonas sediminis TaxID=2056283 RepID=UPI000C80251A|nr:site-specific integrase [Acidimangrovimonas sediminis]
MNSHFVVLGDGVSSPLPKGHPAIWCEDVLHEPACRWLNEEVVPQSRSMGTWDTAARSVVTWLDYCSAASVDWKYALRQDLIAYRDAYLSGISPQTGRHYKPGTVRTRMTFILSFLEHAQHSGSYEGDILNSYSSVSAIQHVRIDSDMLAHSRRGVADRQSASSRKFLPKQSQDDTVRVIRKDELQHLIRWAGPRPSERSDEDAAGSDRDFVLLALGWAVGLRADEMLRLKIYPFESIVVDPAYLGEHHKISVFGKRGKTRRVDVPAWLVEDIQAYIAGERKRALARRGRWAHEGQLLLNGERAKSFAGKPISKTGIDLVIKRACNSCGLVEKSERRNPEKDEIAFVSRPKYSLHCLRHTYAVMTYHSMAAAGFDDVERWKYIQLQLGHASAKTTMDYYLRHVSVWSSRRTASAFRELFS